MVRVFMVYNCSSGENYVVESVRNVVLRWAEHGDPNKYRSSHHRCSLRNSQKNTCARVSFLIKGPQ